MVTSVLFHPLMGAGEIEAVIASGALCVFKAILVLAVFPALSIAVPLKVSLAPALVTWMDAGHESTPETLSAHVKVTVTGSVRTLLFPEGDVAVAMIEGELLSRLIVTEVEEEAPFPAWSTAVPVMLWAAPSLETVTGAGHVAIAKFASLHLNLTVTFVLFHPLPFGSGLIVLVITGAAATRGGVTEAVPLRLPV
jgi:hypothetical protein